MLSIEPDRVKFEERGISEQSPVKFHKRVFHEDVVIRKHYHSSLEINLCENVKGFLVVEGRRFDLANSSLVFMQPNLLHSYNISGNGGSISVWHVGLNLLPFLDGQKIESYLENNHPQFILKNTYTKGTEEYLDLLVKEKGFVQASALLRLFDNILEWNACWYLLSKRDLFLQKIISYSEKNFHSRISLDNAASAVHLSRYHFCRKFKARTGSTFNEYINNLRMEHSLVCLDKGMSVYETAGECGFEDVSYFIKRFRRMYRDSPGRYKNENLSFSNRPAGTSVN